MPFKSEKQRKWMHANDPKMAKKWEKEEKMKKENIKISSDRLREIIEEEVLAKLLEAPDDEPAGNEEPRFGTYGVEKGVPNTPQGDANIDLYQKSVKALNMWVAQKGRPSQRTWRGGAGSFEEVVKRLYPEEYKYVMAKAWTIPIREIPYYYGQTAGEPEPTGGEYGGSETTGKDASGGGTTSGPPIKKRVR